jgi:hypothetical protein
LNRFLLLAVFFLRFLHSDLKPSDIFYVVDASFTLGQRLVQLVSALLVLLSQLVILAFEGLDVLCKLLVRLGLQTQLILDLLQFKFQLVMFRLKCGCAFCPGNASLQVVIVGRFLEL